MAWPKKDKPDVDQELTQNGKGVGVAQVIKQPKRGKYRKSGKVAARQAFAAASKMANPNG